jgi:hypothetical protein
MNDPNRQLLVSAAELLGPLLDELVFVGGCATGLLITDPASGGIRPTIDVDTIVEVKSYAEYAVLSERLRNLGLAEDSTSNVICRWRRGDLLLDVMPTDERILGFSNRWYTPAIATAQWVHVDRVRLRLVTAPYFLATKLEAFRGRGRGDFAGSHDLEDAIAVIDGRAELIGEVASAEADVRGYIAAEMSRLLQARAFLDALPGFLLPDSATQARLPLLLGRLRALAGRATGSA